MAQPTHRYILKWAKMIAPKVRHLAFSREDNQPILFTPGQFITLHIEGPAKILHRSYSIANIPGENNLLELACSYVEGGVASNLLFNLQPEDIVQASGPHGIFSLKDEKPTRYILVATGTGISPYRSMLGDIKHRFENSHPDLKIELLMGVRNPQELLYGEEFVEFAKQHPNFNYHVCYSREGKETLLEHERMGHVQDVFPNLDLKIDQDIVYLCGNPYMIDDAFSVLTTAGFDRKNVRREKYLFSH